MGTTLDDLMVAVRQKSENENSTFISDDELIEYINDGLTELYDMLVLQNRDEFIDGYTFTTQGIANNSIPDDLHTAVALDMKIGTTIYPLQQFNFSERNRIANSTDTIINGVPKFRYRIVKNNITIYPTPEAGYECTLWYIPQCQKLVNTSDKINNNIIDSWSSYIVCSAVLDIVVKESRLDPAPFTQAKDGVAQRIAAIAKTRDQNRNQPELDSGNTLFNLQLQVKARTGFTPDQISITELNTFINSSYAELYDMLIGAYEDYFLADGYSITTEIGRETYPLPNDFYKLSSVELYISGNYVTLPRFNFKERNFYKNAAATTLWYNNVYTSAAVWYTISDNKIWFAPVPEEVRTFTLYYIPQITRLNKDSDVIKNTIIEGWLDYIVVDASIKVLQRIKQDPQLLMAQKQELKDRIQALAVARDFGNPQTVTNIPVSDYILL